MKTNVFKKVGYLTAAFALAASGSIFVPVAVQAEGAIPLTQGMLSAEGGSLPLSEELCSGGARFALSESIELDYSVMIDYPTMCSDDEEMGGYGAGGVTIDLNGYTLTVSDAYGAIMTEDDAELTIEATNGGSIINKTTGPIFSGEGSFTVKGGVYNKQIDPSYVAAGYAEYEVVEQGVWTVDTDIDLLDEISDDIFLKVGEAVDLTDGLSELAKKYFDYSVEMAFDEDANWRDYLGLNGTKITGLKSGELMVEATLHKVGGYIVDVPVFVYDENDDTAEVRVELDTEVRTEEELTSDYATEMEELKEAIGNDNIAGYYDIRAQLVSDNFGWPLVENLGETNEYQAIKVSIPSDVPAVAEGYARTWYFVYHHNGEVKRVVATDNGDGAVTAYSKEFSPYILAYVDTVIATNGETTTETVTSGEAVANNTTANSVAATTKKMTNPNTLDNGLSYIVLAVVAAVTMAGAIVYLVRREA